MSLEQKPSGRFNNGLRKVQAAQAEARSLAVRDYAVRVRAAVDALEQGSDEGTLMMSMQRYHETVTARSLTRAIEWVREATDICVVGDSSLHTDSTADAGGQSRRTLATRSAAVSSAALNDR
jgi:predicted secreted Zn-dependent protease